jgi:hypothetical protein
VDGGKLFYYLFLKKKLKVLGHFRTADEQDKSNSADKFSLNAAAAGLSVELAMNEEASRVI